MTLPFKIELPNVWHPVGTSCSANAPQTLLWNVSENLSQSRGGLRMRPEASVWYSFINASCEMSSNNLITCVHMGTSEFPAHMASNGKNVSIAWRHHKKTKPLTGEKPTRCRHSELCRILTAGTRCVNYTMWSVWCFDHKPVSMEIIDAYLAPWHHDDVGQFPKLYQNISSLYISFTHLPY